MSDHMFKIKSDEGDTLVLYTCPAHFPSSRAAWLYLTGPDGQEAEIYLTTDQMEALARELERRRIDAKVERGETGMGSR